MDILITFLIGVVIDYGACQQHDMSVVNTTRCYPDSFDQGSCTLKCTVTTNETLNSWSWQYFTTYEITDITIYDGVELTSQDDTYTISLTLDDYNAGTYECLSNFSTTPPLTPLSAQIKISGAENGVDLYAECIADHDCNALHAICSDQYYYYTNACLCIAQYFLPYSSGDDSLACLKLKPEGGHCYSQNECNWPTQSYQCIDSHCHCTGNMTQVRINNTVTEVLCIHSAYLHDFCSYDEQCELNDEHSYCYEDEFHHHHCECENGYRIWVGNGIKEDMYCYITGMEGWKIAFIVVGTLLGLAIIGSAIYYLVIKKRN